MPKSALLKRLNESKRDQYSNRERLAGCGGSVAFSRSASLGAFGAWNARLSDAKAKLLHPHPQPVS